MLKRLAPLFVIPLVAANAHADELPYNQVSPYHVEYTAEAGCSSRGEFLRELTQYSERVREAGFAEEAPTFSVKVVPNGNTFAGTLVLKELDGDETQRGASGNSCEEVVTQLAQIAASLADPEIMSKTPPADPARTVEPVREIRKRNGFRFGGAAGFSMATAFAPNLSFGPFVDFTMENEVLDRRTVAFGISGYFTFSETYDTPEGDIDFNWVGGRAWFCPLSLPNQGVFAFAPCAMVEVGKILTDGPTMFEEVDPPPLWLAAGPMIRLELRPVRVVSIFADAMAVFPFLKHEYRMPGYTVFESPVAGFSSQLGVRVLVP